MKKQIGIQLHVRSKKIKEDGCITSTKLHAIENATIKWHHMRMKNSALFQQ